MTVGRLHYDALPIWNKHSLFEPHDLYLAYPVDSLGSPFVTTVPRFRQAQGRRVADIIGWIRTTRYLILHGHAEALVGLPQLHLTVKIAHHDGEVLREDCITN